MRFAVITNNAVTEDFRDYAAAPDSALGPDGLPVLRPVHTVRAPFNGLIHTQTRTVIVEPDRVVERFDSHYRPIDEVRAAVVKAIKGEAFARLKPSDWYSERQRETGKETPVAVLQLRADIRAASNEFERVLQLMPIDQIGAWVRKWPGN